jgi:hypothetical protein
MGHGNEARFGAPVWCGRNSWSAGSRGKLNTTLATLTITDAYKSSSEVYGKIEGFTPPAV